ncbi:bifunctional diguanylate cyclase/phosphodiesterase [Lysinibacillus sp. KU-BSD001]|uniref:putative bifunctional diguanylate cyclase/phosphodiesterase n=1 Tax=Lysinibacillus sp. KU-BSD001 TaxID=3141328 RepID=UPI0036E7D899
MIKVVEKDRMKALQQIIQLNPFDTVIVLKKVQYGYEIECVNEKAVQLFQEPSKEPSNVKMDAECFFGAIDWQTLHPFVEKLSNQVEYINLKLEQQMALYMQKLVINDESYILIVLRAVINQEHFVYEDELTNLFNRRALQHQWSSFTEQRTKRHVALLIIDLDRFKKFNESLGKQKADDMLAVISERFRSLRHKHCEIFRYNGDEFVFVIGYDAQEEVEVLATQILTLLKEPIVVDEQDYYVTASIGIATSIAEQTPQLDTMLHHADQALFYVKNHGRGDYRFYRKEMSQVFPNEALMEAHLRRAIELNELSVHFQPQMDLQSNEINSFEALIRWHNRKFGFVSPAQFIPLAESSGLIIEIGDWVLERVCQYLQEWKQKGYRPVRIAVNISPKQFKQGQFARKVERVMKQYDIDPAQLELEITEGSMTNVHETTAILNELKQLGLFVSVDDFGTGYSSLSYLKTYPIDIIKIDQSFIADIEEDEKNEAIVKAIILLSHTLGLEVIAEGVEKKNQEQFLLKNHCKKVQGYLYNKPLPVEEIVEQYLIN